MALTTAALQTNANTRLSDLTTSNRHCVFHCGGSWFSVPAVSVREIVITPELVRVPCCHRALAGLAHLRSEFIPVIALGTLLDIGRSSGSTESGCLLVLEGSQAWSLLISGCAGLESMETIVSQEAGMEAAADVVLGTAMFRDRIVRVLSPTGLLAVAQEALDHYWNQIDS